MAVGLSLTGRLAPPDADRLSRSAARDWLARAAVWFEAAGDAVLTTRLVRDDEDRTSLLVGLHPASEDAEVRLTASGKVKVSAKTSPAGPGYHAHLCGLLDQLAADFGFAWDEPPADADPAGYWIRRDRGRLERHFLHWLGSACTAALRAGPHDGRHAVGMPRHPRFLHPGPVLTPLGPRPVEWLSKTAADPSAAADFFPWWGPDLDAGFYRGQALTLLWLDFRGRPPLTEGEGEVVDQIAADLANALDLDAAADLPFAAWAEVIAAIGGDTLQHTVEPVSDELAGLVIRRAREQGGVPPIGYRRHDVEAHLTGGWHVTVPGSFANEWAEDARTWTAWANGRTVWFRDRPLGSMDAPVPPPAAAVAAARNSLPAGEHLPPRAAGDLVGEAVWGPHEENGKPVWRLCGIAAAGGRLAACNVYVTREEDRPWAERVWASLGHAGHGHA